MSGDLEEQKADPAAKKKAAQHEAWLRWYRGPKGEAYRAKRRKGVKEKLQEPAK